MTQPPRPANPELTPDPLMQLAFSFAPARVLSAGVQLDLFSHVGAGHATAEEVARAAGTDARATKMLLDALAGLQLLTKDGARYGLTPLSAEYLVRGSPNYAGAMMEDDHLWESWGRLTEVVRTGRPAGRVESRELAEQFFPVLVRSLHVMNLGPARRAARALGAGTEHRGLRVLDVACGSAVWSIAVAEADPDARLTAQDFPGVFDTTRLYLERHGVADRYDFLPGDLKEVDFGEGRYDLALLGNIVHSEGERSSRDLFRRLRRALRPGGRVVVVDMLPNEERTGPPFALFFAINMLVNTEEGGTYTLGEYTDWLNEAGFPRVEAVEVGFHSPLVVGFKE